MSTNLNYKQIANVSRRTWDVEAYEKKAKARQEAAANGELPRKEETDVARSAKSDEKEEFVPAERGASGPEGSKRAFLKARQGKVDVDSKVGTSEMVSVEAAAAISTGSAGDQAKAGDGVVKTGIGWHCKVCDCFLKDSHTYLDHINGKKHQRKLGYSMRVERSTKEQLLHRLKNLTKEKAQKDKEKEAELNCFANESDYDKIVRSKDEELHRLKEERRRRRKEKKKQHAEGKQTAFEEKEEEKNERNEEKGEEGEDAGVDPALAAMMGFSGFGSSKSG